ncbi:MAG TPA: hypothetical protein VM513_18275 [Kofleriaceae bacterium]|jgi:hypothetical protein|nr:hypothetical protein [Kofleriaceae bacterium]
MPLKLDRVAEIPSCDPGSTMATAIVYVAPGVYTCCESNSGGCDVTSTRSRPGASTWHAVQSQPRSRRDPV